MQAPSGVDTHKPDEERRAIDQPTNRSQRNDKKPTLRLTFAGVLSVSVFLTAAILITVSYLGARSNALTVSESMMQHVAHLATERVAGFLDPIGRTTGTIRGLLERGTVDPADFGALERLLFEVMENEPSVTMLNYGDEQDRFLMVRRMPDGSLATKRITWETGRREVRWRYREPGAGVGDVVREELVAEDNYRPTQRPWYQGAVETGGLHWSNAYVFYTTQRPGITASSPVIDDGSLRGVLGVDVDIIEFSHFLATLDVTEDGHVLVLDRGGHIVASPAADDLVEEEETHDGPRYVLQLASHSSVPQIAAIVEMEAFERSLPVVDQGGGEQDDAAAGEGITTLRFEVGSEVMLGVLRPIELDPNQVWIIAVTIPEDSLLALVKATNRRNIIISIALLAVALLASILIARSLSKSLKQLESESSAIREFDFRARPDVSTRFLEVQNVLEAFEDVKTGLRGFARYLPLELVRVLLERREEPVLESEELEVTIFFSDIAGFSTIAESLEPSELSVRLGHYLATLTDCIESHEGTVVQYVGDAIMAFWGAPSPVESHARKACDAALECRRLVDSMWQDEPDFPKFDTRFGIHTDRVAVGHFGSPHRLYYGAVGDGVNIAARLESANKSFDTRIIISEHTREQIGQNFAFRRLDRVNLVGRATPTDLFELRGPSEGAADPLVTAYEAAFQAYVEGRFDEAAATLSTAMETHPDDTPAKQLLERCKEYVKAPPPEGWDGVFTMTKK